MSELRSEPKIPVAILLLLFLVFLPLACVYLFVLPMMTALNPLNAGWPGVAFSGFLLAQTFALAIELSYSAGATFYGLKRTSLFRHPLEVSNVAVGSAHALFLLFMGYALFIYAFGVLYVFISHLDPQSFNVGGLSAFDGVYFSTVTSATIGYGDIVPKSAAAKTAVISQTMLSILFVTVLFSATSSHLRDRVTDTRAHPTIADVNDEQDPAS